MMGFGMVWHMWWMAILGTLGMLVSWIAYTFEKEKSYYVEIEEIETIENRHHQAIAQSRQRTDEAAKERKQTATNATGDKHPASDDKPMPISI